VSCFPSGHVVCTVLLPLKRVPAAVGQVTLRERSVADEDMKPLKPIGLPNRGNDCFWLAALQCLRHIPGITDALGAHHSESADDLAAALAGLFRGMDMAAAEGRQISSEDAALSAFRRAAALSLPASDGGRHLVQEDEKEQQQQDTHEFLSQLLDALSSAPLAGERPPTPRACDEQGSARLEAIEKELTVAAELRAAERLLRCPEGHMLQPWDAQPGSCDGCGRRIEDGETVMDCRCCNWYLCEACHSRDVGDPEARERESRNADNLLYEYSMVQWAASSTRMQSRALGALFEGQCLASVRCASCGRYGASGAEPFTVEEVKVGDHYQEEPSLASRFSSWIGLPQPEPPKARLGDLLRESAESPAPEGYRCPNRDCACVGSSSRTMQFLRLPSTLVLHVNRARAGGSRCEVPLNFGPILDLGKLGLVAHFGQPLDRNLEVCSTCYNLIGAVFHRGATERSGHYFAYVFVEGEWVRLDNESVARPTEETEATPMALEESEPASGARVALLFYRRDDT